MCSVCGCGEGEVRIGSDSSHALPHEHVHPHDHGPEHAHAPPVRAPGPMPSDAERHHYGTGPARAHAPGMAQARMVQIEQDILSKNDAYAAANRRWLAERGILALNLVSGPGAGKTTLLARTLRELSEAYPMAVIEGDQETSNDAERIRAAGARALQINTGKGCHLDAHMVGHALESLDPDPGAVLFIENVGNLVCPAAFDLGEAYRVVILSVTEGEDKPVKYPDIFRRADLLLVHKIDLLPHLTFDLERCLEFTRQVNPGLQALCVSSTSGEGLEDWYRWLKLTREARLVGHPALGTPSAARDAG